MLREWMEICLFLDERGYSRHKSSMEGACMFQGQIGKLPLKSRGD